MQKLSVSYSVWKQIVQNNNWGHYYFAEEIDFITTWTGTQDYIYSTSAGDTDFDDWYSVFSGVSTRVDRRDDATALILNLGSPVSTTALSAPAEADGRPVFVNAPFSEGLYMWITSRGDDLSPASGTGKGCGQPFYLSFDGPGELSLDLEFSEPFELHDGHMSWSPVDNWGFQDEWTFCIKMPATVTTANAVGSGNCNLFPIGGGKNLIIPANDDGGYDVDLDEAVPVPAGTNGFWDADQITDDIVPTSPYMGNSYLFDHEKTVDFMKNLNCGHNLGLFDFDAYKCEWISSKWRLHFSVNKVTTGSGEIGGWIMSYRGDTSE